MGPGCFPLRYATQPFAVYAQLCYIVHCSNANLTISRRITTTQGSPRDPTRGLNALAHPATRLKQPSPSPHPTGPVYPSLSPRRWKDALVRYRSMCAPSKTPSASYRDPLPREGSRSLQRAGRVSPAPRSSRLLDRMTSRAPVDRALRVTPANSNILRLQEPRRSTPDAESPPPTPGCSQPPGAGLGPVGPDGPCLVRRVRALGRRSGRRLIKPQADRRPCPRAS